MKKNKHTNEYMISATTYNHLILLKSSRGQLWACKKTTQTSAYNIEFLVGIYGEISAFVWQISFSFCVLSIGGRACDNFVD